MNFANHKNGNEHEHGSGHEHEHELAAQVLLPNVEAVLPEEDGRGGLGTAALQTRLLTTKNHQVPEDDPVTDAEASDYEYDHDRDRDRNRRCFTHTTQ